MEKVGCGAEMMGRGLRFGSLNKAGGVGGVCSGGGWGWSRCLMHGDILI